MCICHHCDNPKCCNPKHLFLGTHSENMKDMWDKNRHPTDNMGRPSETMLGMNNPNVKLSGKDVLTIRKRYDNGCSQSELASLYNIGRPAIWKIIHRKTWRHI